MIETIVSIIIFIYIISRCCCVDDNVPSKPKTPTKSTYTPKVSNKNNSYNTEMSYGGYCDSNCIYCHSDWYDDEGVLVGGYTSGGYEEYYCSLGHSLRKGRFCEDYK